MFSKWHNWFFLSLLAGVLASIGIAEDKKEDDEDEAKKLPFSVKFIDEDGKPVEGAIAGVSAYIGYEGSTLTTVDSTGWQYDLGVTSNADGVANFSDGRDRKFLCVVARHTKRNLVAIWKIDSQKLESEKATEMVAITMHPECRVVGRLACSDLTKHGREVGWTNVDLKLGRNRAFGCSSNNQTFHFFVPPGEYVLNSYGSNLHDVDKQFSVKAGQRELDIGTIELPATRLALLEGQPAPKLEGIKCWKNGPAVALESLKGKCVILDFWGYWCGPCVHRMPELFTLHDKYHDDGLEIVGIHIDLGEDEKEPVDTVEKLDEKLMSIRKDVWSGRDVPYPVGLVSGSRTSFGTTIETRKARSEISAIYGVTMYPTLILIDRQGNVVKRFAPNQPDDIALLEKLLKDH